MNKKILTLIIISLCFVSGLFSYYLMPDQMASHWNIEGQVDGYVSRNFGIFFLPSFLLILALILLFVPQIDPLKKNIDKFKDDYEMFIVWFAVFFFYVYVLTLFWNMGISFNMNTALMPALGFFFFYVGVLIEKAKRNYFIGIRTPWTLASDKVWDKTHKLGSKLFKLTGLLVVVSALFPQYSFLFVFVPIIFISLFLIIYSYNEFRKEEK
ncbi:MAG TPA: SdpI family protein [Candidatus Pacearchaeota archaeon]|nr:SdpI family protein [Candidatus Pacearchaeota archaeon]